jgi:hypothetical protein
LGIPIPRRHKKEEQAQLQSTSGMLRRILKDQVVVEADDHRILNFKRTGATHFLKMGNPIKPADLKPGDYIEVEASQDDEGFLTAVNVMWQQDGSAKDRAHAAEPVEISVAKSSKGNEKESAKESAASEPEEAPAKPASQDAAPAQPAPAETNPADLNAPAKDEVKSAQIDPDDEGPPVLKRGGKAVRKAAESAPPSAWTIGSQRAARGRSRAASPRTAAPRGGNHRKSAGSRRLFPRKPAQLLLPGNHDPLSERIELQELAAARRSFHGVGL